MPGDWSISPQVQFWISRASANIWRGALYYLIVVAVFGAIWLWWHYRPGRRMRLQVRPVQARQVGREILSSIGPVLAFGLIVPILFALGLGKHFQYYRNISDRGWPYFLLSITLLLLIQDTWFYWTHRLMHHRRLFRWFHSTHHRSTNPNPWTTYSMSVLEAIVLSGSTVISLFIIPTTGAALVIIGWLNLIYGVYGHLGYELYPRTMAGHWLGRWINTSVAHNGHHAKGRYNYGYYFLFWDRLMGTLDPDYEAHYQRRGARKKMGSDPNYSTT